MEGWVDDSEIAVVNWEMNFCLCCNRYSASWSAKVIGVDRSALIISGEFSSGLASDALGRYFTVGNLKRLEFILNIYGSSIFTDPCPPLGIRQDMQLFLEVRSYVISNAAWESFRSFVSGNLCDWVWRWEVTSFRSAVNSFVISLFAASKAAWEAFRSISSLDTFFNNNDNSREKGIFHVQLLKEFSAFPPRPLSSQKSTGR